MNPFVSMINNQPHAIIPLEAKDTLASSVTTL
jgi:hypothetical protein